MAGCCGDDLDVSDAGSRGVPWTLYADMLLGAAMIYVLIMFLRWQEEKREFHFGCMLLGLAVVVLTKQAGMILGAILVLVIAGTTLAVQPETNRKSWLWMI